MICIPLFHEPQPNKSTMLQL